MQRLHHTILSSVLCSIIVAFTGKADPLSTWTAVGASKKLYGLASSGNQHMAVGTSGAILTSSNGDRWTARVSGTATTLYSVAWNGSLFVAVGGTGTILSSPDGITWSNRTSGTTRWLHGVAWGNGQSAVAGEFGAI